MQKPNPNRDNDERTEHQGLGPKTNHPGSAGGQLQSHNSKTDPPAHTENGGSVDNE
jgi:hypothetical protein